MLADKLGSLAPIMLEEPEQTRELLRRFGKMPFAIEQLGAILQKRAGTPNVVSTVLARFARTGITDTTDLIAHMLADTVGLLSEDMATAFVELAAHPRGEFTEESADALLGRSAERIVDELRAVGLVSPSWQGRHRMHWYAKRYAAELAEQRGIDTGAAFDRVLAFYARRAVAADMVDEDRLRCYTVPEVEPWPAGLNRVDWLDAEAKVLAELAELAADRGRDEEVGQLCAGLEILMLHRGRYQLCLQALDAGVRAATVLDNRALLGRQHGLRGRALTMLHIFDRAQSELDTAWQIVGTVDNPRLVSSTCEMFGRLFEEQVDYQGTQDYTAAINAFDRALVIDRENRDHRATALHARMKANAMTKGGCAGEAPPLLTEAWKLLLEQDNRNRSRVCLVWAKAAVAMRDPVTASTQLELSRRYADEAKATSYWAETTEVAATLAELTGDRAAARSRWGELVQYYVDNGHPRSLRYQRRLTELAQ
jgi:tetratricopeptide (TPR) repeat protein